MKRQVLISRSSVMRLVEAISITIAQHTGSAVETLWASEGDQSKLDVYYREAISDLERNLAGYIDTTSTQFNLQDEASDYTLSLNLSDMWATRMYGVLCNKVQDYIVHSITAGWLNDFAGLEIKQGYREMAAQDIADILYLVARKEFGFTETGRNDIVDDKILDIIFSSVSERIIEGQKDTADRLFDEVSERSLYDKAKTEQQINVGLDSRHSDNSRVRIKRDCINWSGVGKCMFPLRKWTALCFTRAGSSDYKEITPDNESAIFEKLSSHSDLAYVIMSEGQYDELEEKEDGVLYLLYDDEDGD